MKNTIMFLCMCALSIGTLFAQVVTVDKTTGMITPLKAGFRTLSESEAAGYKAQIGQQQTQTSKQGMGPAKTWTFALEGETGGGIIGITPKQTTFSGMVREDGDYAFAFFDEVWPGMTILVCNERPKGGDCSETVQFLEYVPPSPGSLYGVVVPVIRNHYGQTVTAYEFRNGKVQTASINAGTKRAKRIVSAAHEKHMQIDGGSTETVIQISGDFNHEYPYTIFAGYTRLLIKPLMVTNGTPRETLVRVLNQDALAQMGESYPLTVCQFGCNEVDMTHLPLPMLIGVGGGGTIPLPNVQQ